MTYVLNPPTDQRSFHRGITWEKFKLIEQGFSESPGVRLFYYQGDLEIVAVSLSMKCLAASLECCWKPSFWNWRLNLRLPGP
jgi:hypothetical protein